MLLIYPPATRSTEAPLGIARLAGFLRSRSREAYLLDLNQEGLDYLLGLELEAGPEDAWTRLALGRRQRELELLRSPRAVGNFGAYSKAVRDLGRSLRAAGLAAPRPAEPGLADYRDPALSPLRRADLLEAARDFASSVYFPLFRNRLEAVLPELQEPLVGLSLTFLSQALPAFALLGYLRARWPGLRLVLGGGLVTSWMSQASLGPQENFGGLVDALLPGRGEEGLAQWLGLEPEPGFVPPSFDGLPMKSYLSPGRILPWNFSSGCPWKRCTFCPELAEDGAYRACPRPQALEELDQAIARVDPVLLHFTDSEIAPLYLRGLAENPPGRPWYGFARFSSHLADPGFCRALADSGCVMLQLGLESGDQAVLDAMGKGSRLVEIDRAINALSDAGIGLYLYVLFGTPAEDRDAALRTRDFVAERAGRIGFLNVAIFNMPLASPDAARFGKGSFYPGDYSLYCEFAHPLGWDRDRVRGFVARDFEAEPSIRPIILRNPPVFTSSHAPFFSGIYSSL